jgi:hypothetical protein
VDFREIGLTDDRSIRPGDLGVDGEDFKLTSSVCPVAMRVVSPDESSV